jgi:hypothetical protein
MHTNWHFILQFTTQYLSSNRRNYYYFCKVGCFVHNISNRIMHHGNYVFLYTMYKMMDIVFKSLQSCMKIFISVFTPIV